MDLGLRDRVYVVTGGTKGLGYATAQALVGDGARVIVSSRSQESVDKALATLGHGARGVAADNADPATPERLVQEGLSAFGRLDGALISVGGPPGTAALGATDEQWQAAFESVFLGAVRTARALVPHLSEGASIGLVLSSSVKSPLRGLEISNGLRPGLAMWAKDLADELGPRGIRVFSLMPGRIRRGIRVFSLMPGRIRTDRTLSLTPSETDRERLAQSIPLRRMGEPEEFGRVAAFLLSPAASYLTGLAVPVDGGALRSL